MLNRIAILVTNFNNSDFTINLYNSIIKIKNHGILYDFYVCDNASKEEEKAILDRISNEKNVFIINSNINLGYFGGLNKLIETINPEEYDYVIIGNNDIIFDNTFFLRLYETPFSSKYPVICPNIISKDGMPQNPHVIKPPSKFRELIYDLYYSNYLLSRLILLIANLTRKYTQRGDEENHGQSQELIQGYGAMYILTPIFFEHFDKLWNLSFLMYEEFFLSEQLKSKRLKLIYDSTIIIYHEEHASISKIPSKQFWKLSRKAHKIYRQFVKIY